MWEFQKKAAPKKGARPSKLYRTAAWKWVVVGWQMLMTVLGVGWDWFEIPRDLAVWQPAAD